MSKQSELIPNSFQMPNVVVDRLLPALKPPAAMVLMVLCRKTFGWHKSEDVIAFSQFRKATGLSRSTVIEALNRLTETGLVIKAPAQPGKEGNSWSFNLNADPESVLERLMPGVLAPADGDIGVVRIPDRSTKTTSLPDVPVDVDDRSTTNTLTSPPGGPTKPISLNPNTPPTPFASPVEEVWEYFLATLHKGPHYEFTKQRRLMGEAGFGACRKMASANGSPNPAAAAVTLMKIAVDRLRHSKFHNGANDEGKKYLDWDVLFRGRNKPCPQKLTEYWLNDDNFPDDLVGAA